MGMDVEHNGEKGIDFSNFENKIPAIAYPYALKVLEQNKVEYYCNTWNVPKDQNKLDKLNFDAIFYTGTGEVVAYFDQQNGVIYF